MTGSFRPPENGERSTRLRLPFEPASVSLARRQLVDALKANSLSATLVSDAALVITELATNAIRHGRPIGDNIEIAWHLGDDHLTVSVRDAGTPADLRPRTLTTNRTGGRGLAIVDSLRDSWRTDREDGITVTAELGYRCA